jgi:hypothetical protein
MCRLILVPLVLALALSPLGCGPGARDTGKNKDMDRPKSADVVK